MSKLLNVQARFLFLKSQELNGKILEFLTPNRPARRYLYFRYLCTYFHWKKQGDTDWVSWVEARGMMWATPGPYLRQLMLKTLAKEGL
jgi:hypothetical protein